MAKRRRRKVRFPRRWTLIDVFGPDGDFRLFVVAVFKFKKITFIFFTKTEKTRMFFCSWVFS